MAADASKSTGAIKPDAPDRYVVVPGDTLWGIAQRFTDSPWRWPDLWNLNRDQIKNPHRIYPGNVIVLDRVHGRLTISGSESSPGASSSSGSSSLSGTEALHPRVRVLGSTDAPIPSIPPSVIEPFLSQPLVIEPGGLDNAPTIVATQQDRVILESGNSAYVRGIGSSKEKTWNVYRAGSALVDPDTDRTLGYEAIFLGTAQVTRAGDPTTVRLASVKQEVGVGDKLIPAGPPQTVNYAPHSPSVFIKGRVMSIYGGVQGVDETGTGSIVTINRGKSDGIDVGTVLAVYTHGQTVTDTSKPTGARDAQIDLPDEPNGHVFVFRVFDRVSYALVMRIERPVQALDVVETP
ncbi:MAG TPA: LysM domain-containing protein [Burkholderiales bacterium]|nr:LysM domain-containing protein [Burkholderiales bacterium]